jgi:hypothetical protein
MRAYDAQLAQLQRNADAMITSARASMEHEFALIDRAHDIKAANRSKPRAIQSGPTIHDLCANNPLLRKLIRDMQGR